MRPAYRSRTALRFLAISPLDYRGAKRRIPSRALRPSARNRYRSLECFASNPEMRTLHHLLPEERLWPTRTRTGGHVRLRGPGDRESSLLTQRSGRSAIRLHLDRLPTRAKTFDRRRLLLVNRNRKTRASRSSTSQRQPGRETQFATTRKRSNNRV